MDKETISFMVVMMKDFPFYFVVQRYLLSYLEGREFFSFAMKKVVILFLGEEVDHFSSHGLKHCRRGSSRSQTMKSSPCTPPTSWWSFIIRNSCGLLPLWWQFVGLGGHCLGLLNLIPNFQALAPTFQARFHHFGVIFDTFWYEKSLVIFDHFFLSTFGLLLIHQHI